VVSSGEVEREERVVAAKTRGLLPLEHDPAVQPDTGLATRADEEVDPAPFPCAPEPRPEVDRPLARPCDLGEVERLARLSDDPWRGPTSLFGLFAERVEDDLLLV
jgi:hypothetical protein